MVSINEFQNEMNRLHRAFGAVPTSRDMDRHLDKLDEWFGIWNKTFPETSSMILQRMVDRAIGECERLPNFAQLKNLRQTVLSELPRQREEETPCSMCNKTGLISATKDGHKYSLRCHCCENWQGKYDGLPAWNGRRQDEGYEPDENEDRFDPHDLSQVKGLALLKEAAPKLYQEIISKNPEMRAPVEAIGKTPPMLKDMPSSGSPMSEETKERLRAESLKQDAARDGGEDDIPF